MEVNKNNLFLFVQKYPVGHCIFVIGQKSSFMGNEFTRRAGQGGELGDGRINWLFIWWDWIFSIQSMFSNNWCKNWWSILGKWQMKWIINIFWEGAEWIMKMGAIYGTLNHPTKINQKIGQFFALLFPNNQRNKINN